MITKKMCTELLEGSLTYNKKYLSGFYKDYYITIDFRAPIYIVYINATPDNDAGKAMFESFLKQYHKSTQYLSKAESKDYVIKLRIVEPKPKKIIVSKLNEIIAPVIKQLRDCKYRSGCINCGSTTEPVSCYEISTYHHYICENCVQKIEGDFIEKQNATRAKKANPITGFIGAFLGAVLGVVLWVILYNNNLYGWLAGIAIVFAAYKGYEMLGGHLDQKGFITCTILSIIMMFVGNHIAWVWSALDAARIAGFKDTEIILLWKVLAKEHFVFNYCLDLFLSYLFTFILGQRLFKKLYHNCVGSYSIKKCD